MAELMTSDLRSERRGKKGIKGLESGRNSGDGGIGESGKKRDDSGMVRTENLEFGSGFVDEEGVGEFLGFTLGVLKIGI